MKRQPPSLRACLLLAVVPLFLLMSAQALRGARGPYYLGYNADPSYLYLFNSLLVAGFQAPVHVDHPGTPLQVLGAGVIAAKSVFSGGKEGLTTHVLKNPESYLAVISACLVLLIAGAAFLVGYRILRLTGDIWAALAPQLSLLCFHQTTLALSDVSAEPMLVLSGLLLILVLAPVVFGEDGGSDGYAAPVLAGVVLGFGTADKFTFAPLAVVVLLFSGNRRRAAACFAAVLAFVLFTLPIAASYRRMFAWLAGLLTHEGAYGYGREGFPGIGTLAGNALSFIKGEPFLFVSLACYLAALAGGKMLRKLPLVGCSVIVVQVAASAKHPGIHYLLPCMVFAGLVNAGLCHSFRTMAGSRLMKDRWSAACLVVLACGLASNAGQVVGDVRSWEALAVETGDIYRRIGELTRSGDCVTACYYRASHQRYALFLGNSFSGWRFASDLARLYPETMFYNLWDGAFLTFDKPVTRDAISAGMKKGGCLLVYGAPMDLDFRKGEYLPFRYDLMLETELRTPRSALYRLKGFRKAP